MTSGEAATNGRGAGWWIRSVLMVLVPIGIIALRPPLPPWGLVMLWVVAQIGSVYVFQPDTLGWRLSSMPSWIEDGRAARPSERWRVAARLSGLFLVGFCFLGAVLLP